MINNLEGCGIGCGRYSAYDYDGLSVQELLCQFFTKINECVNDVNKYTEMVKEMLEWIHNEGLEKEVIKQLDKWLADGTLENIINKEIFKDLNNKLDLLVGKSVTLNKYYTNDFWSAVKLAMADGYKTIDITGRFEANMSHDIQDIEGLTLMGEALVTPSVSKLDKFVKFTNCTNLKIRGIQFDGMNKEVLATFLTQDCTNVEFSDLKIRNILNPNPETQFFGLRIACRNFLLDNIFFENIKQEITQDLITTGKGSLQLVMCKITDQNKYGVIKNIKAFETYNIDATKRPVFGDADVIKLQYENIQFPAYSDLLANVLIQDIYGHNFGKRLVKLQVAGCIAKNIVGEANYKDVYCPIALHYGSNTVEGIKFKGEAQAVIETGRHASNITIKDYEFAGSCTSNFITFGDNKKNPTIMENIVLENINIKSNIQPTSEGCLFKMNASSKNIKVSNLQLNDSRFDKGLIGINNKDGSMILDLTVINSDIGGKVEYLCENELPFKSFNLIMENVKAKYSILNKLSVLPVLNYKSIDEKGSKLIFNNVDFEIYGSVSYQWGSFRLINFEIIDLQNSKLLFTDNQALNIVDGDKVRIKDTEINKESTIQAKKKIILNDVDSTNTINIKKSSSSNSLILGLENINFIPSIVNPQGMIIKSSDVFVLEKEVSINNSQPATVQLDLIGRIPNVKILNAYIDENQDEFIVDIRNTSYTNVTAIVRTNKLSVTKTVKLKLVYSF